MSDLQCAATLLVARHGEATYDDPSVATNDGGWLTTLGRRQAVDLAESLADKRIAGIWCSDLARAVQTAEIASARLGDLPVRVRTGLREASVGDFAGEPDADAVFDRVYLPWLDGDMGSHAPGGESGVEVLRRVTAELESAADQYRGETILIVSHSGAIGLTLPALARNVPHDFARDKTVTNGGVCEIVVDDDGWLLRTWNGGPV